MTPDSDAEALLKWIATVDSLDGNNHCGEILERFRKGTFDERRSFEEAVRSNPIVWSTSKTSLFDHYLESCAKDRYWREALTIVALTRGFGDWRETIMWLESAWKRTPDSRLKLDELHAIGPLACRTNAHGISGMSTQGLILNAFFNIVKSQTEPETLPMANIVIDDVFAPQKYVILCRTRHCCVAHLTETEELRLAFEIVRDTHRSTAESETMASFEVELQSRIYAAESLTKGCTGFVEFFEAELNRQNTLALQGTRFKWSNAAERVADSFCIPSHESALLQNGIQVCYQEGLRTYQEAANVKKKPVKMVENRVRIPWWKRILRLR